MLSDLFRRIVYREATQYVSSDTLRAIVRAEQRQGWDREAAGCGPWRSPRQLAKLRRAEAREGARVAGRRR